MAETIQNKLDSVEKKVVQSENDRLLGEIEGVVTHYEWGGGKQNAKTTPNHMGYAVVTRTRTTR